MLTKYVPEGDLGVNVIWYDLTQGFPNTVMAITPMLEQISKWLADEKAVLQHIQIDGIDIYSDYESYIIEHIDTINTIEIKSLSMEQAVQQVCLSASSYLERAIPQLELLFGDFYRNAASDAWDRLAEWIDGMLWLNDTAQSMSSYWAEATETLLAYQSKVDEVLPDLETAVGGRDAITIGDIIQYEALPAFRELKSGIDSIIDRLVVRSDVN
jgi:hypothetical protein